jgi:hypothetical protein
MEESRIGRDRITMSRSMTPELRLMVAPSRTYAGLARQPSPVGPITSLRRPLLAAAVLGVSMAISATGHVTPALVLSTTLCWSFVIVLQIAIAMILIARPARRTVGVARALDLFFASHAPWSFWMLAVAAWAPSPVGRPLTPLLLLALVPIVLTPRMIAAFFREVVGLDRRQALARTAVQQATTWALFTLLYGTAVAFWPRVFQWLG